MKFHIVTIFPNMFNSYLDESILRRAIDGGHVEVKLYDPRDFTKDKHSKVDDKPYGGGPGMVMAVQPIIDCVSAINKKVRKNQTLKVYITSPGGEMFTNGIAQKNAKKYDHIIIICGRYEGIDTRVRKILRATEISIGDYVLTGGELAAMVMIDAISRQVPGVLGKLESLEENRISSHEMYTRPEVFEYKGKKYKVPKVLLSGNHKKIDEWREGKNLT
jgi:tRNA (guanine37-N1)-methyltransferase